MARDSKEWWKDFTPILSHHFFMNFVNKQNKGDDYETLIQYDYNMISIRLWSSQQKYKTGFHLQECVNKPTGYPLNIFNIEKLFNSCKIQ